MDEAGPSPREREHMQPVEQPPPTPPPPVPVQHIRPHLVNQQPLGVRHPDRLPENLIRHLNKPLPRDSNPPGIPRVILLHNLALFGIL